jgi:hypothetical protein
MSDPKFASEIKPGDVIEGSHQVTNVTTNGEMVNITTQNQNPPYNESTTQYPAPQLIVTNEKG